MKTRLLRESTLKLQLYNNKLRRKFEQRCFTLCGLKTIISNIHQVLQNTMSVLPRQCLFLYLRVLPWQIDTRRLCPIFPATGLKITPGQRTMTGQKMLVDGSLLFYLTGDFDWLHFQPFSNNHKPQQTKRKSTNVLVGLRRHYQ